MSPRNILISPPFRETAPSHARFMNPQGLSQSETLGDPLMTCAWDGHSDQAVAGRTGLVRVALGASRWSALESSPGDTLVLLVVCDTPRGRQRVWLAALPCGFAWRLHLDRWLTGWGGKLQPAGVGRLVEILGRSPICGAAV